VERRWVSGCGNEAGFRSKPQNLIRVKVAAVVAIVVGVVMGDGVRRRRAAGEWNGDRGGFGCGRFGVAVFMLLM
jgi:hypothetical protein